MKRLVSASLAILLFALVTMPVYATTYAITFKLYVSGSTEPLWIGVTSIETEDGVKNIPVPQTLYDLIMLWVGTDTFVTPFTVNITMVNIALEVTSDPTGLMLVFVPMNPGDINADRTVDIFDVVQVGTVYGRYDLFADLNFDRHVDIFDVVLVANNYGNEY